MSEPIIPYILYFQSNGDINEGFISIASQNSEVPFEIKRAFWTYDTPIDVSRGRHAHYETQMLLIAVCGEIRIETTSINGKKNSFQLDHPNMGIYIPKLCWHEMWYSTSAVQLVLTSTLYDERDYIRDIIDFEKLQRS